jgi:hypothetical protein
MSSHCRSTLVRNHSAAKEDWKPTEIAQLVEKIKKKVDLIV